MKDKIAVRKIDIQIWDKTISLKPEQAKELKKILNEMFEESPEKVVHEHHYQYWWNWPAYISTQPAYPQWTITCGASNSFSGVSNAGSHATASSDTVTLALNAA